MSADSQDLINKLIIQKAMNQSQQPSFMGLQAPPDPNQMDAALAQIKQAQLLAQANKPTEGTYGYLHDAGRSAFNSIGSQLGAGLAQLGNPAPQPTQNKGPAFTMPTVDPAAPVDPTAAAPIPTPTQGANAQQSVSNMVLAAKSYYSSQVNRGVDPDQAKVATAKALVSWGAPNADEMLDNANQALMKNNATRAETDKNVSQGKMDAANILNQQNEQAHRSFEEGGQTFHFVSEKDGVQLYMNANGEPKVVTTQPSKTIPAATAPVDPNLVTNLAAGIKAGRIPAFTGTALKTPVGMAVTAALAADPEYDGTTYPTKAKAMIAFATGAEGKQVASMNVTQSHLGTLGEAADALNNGSIPLANKALNMLGVQAGGTAQAAFDATKNVVANEIVKTIVPGQSAESDRKEIQNEITAAQTPAQLKAVISKYNELLSGKLAGLRQQYETSTGLKNFEAKLSQKTLDLAHNSPTYTAQFPNPTQPNPQPGAPANTGSKRVYNPATGTFQ